MHLRAQHGGFFAPKGNDMTDKTKHRDSTDSPHSGPIRPGSVLHRALETVAAEIVRKLSAHTKVDATPSTVSEAEDESKAADID